MIAAMLEPSARERCELRHFLPTVLHSALRFEGRKADIKITLFATVSRISLTRHQLAGQVEDLLVRMGQQGQVRGKVTDEALKGLLEQVGKGGFKLEAQVAI